METLINLAVVLVMFLGFWLFPKVVERFITLGLGIYAMITGTEVKDPKKNAHSR